MKLCIAADLHLPYNEAAPQYRAFGFALADAKKKNADLIIFAGDETADGNPEAAKAFTETVQNCGVPYLVIPGNSDLRSGLPSPVEASPTVTDCGSFRIFILNDSSQTISDVEFSALDAAEENDLVFMHHPQSSLSEPSRTRFAQWRAAHPETTVFCAHIHKSRIDGKDIVLPALDPDKAIGENPCVIYYDTDTGSFEKSYYSCPMPADFFARCGISCYRPLEDIDYSAAHSLASLELRPNATDFDFDVISEKIRLWRQAGGKNLSIHFPDAVWKDGEIHGREKLLSFCDLACNLNADRITVHVPRINADEAYSGDTMERLSRFYAEIIDSLPENCTAGIENLHMKEKDRQNGTRPFGVIPEDCLDLLSRIKKLTSHPVGINLDIGHARNNAPHSQKYTLGAWYAEVGRYCVGYHVHQVELNSGVFENHMPITDHCGKLISLASFYDSLSAGQLADAPVIFEIRPLGGAAKTVEFFENEQNP